MCTNIVLSPSQCHDSMLSARTMDLQDAVTWNVDFVPAGTPFPKLPPPDGITWSSKHAFVGVSAKPLSLYYDGINQEGLSAATLLLPGSTYQSPSNSNNNISIGDVAAWALGMYATVEEVKAGLEGLTVVAQSIGSYALNLHVVFADRHGRSLVLEMVNGQQRLHDSVPVLTNAPTLDWQRTNLSNYANLGLVNGPQEFFGQELNGSGLIGIPGDFTPPSRFARASALVGSQFVPTSTQQSVGLALQLLHALTVPYGGIQSNAIQTINNDGNPIGDCTQWGVVRDHKHARYYYYSAFENVLSCIDLGAVIKNGNGKTVTVPMATGSWCKDASRPLFG